MAASTRAVKAVTRHRQLGVLKHAVLKAAKGVNDLHLVSLSSRSVAVTLWLAGRPVEAVRFADRALEAATVRWQTLAEERGMRALAAAQMSITKSSCGRAQQIRTFPSAGESSG